MFQSFSFVSMCAKTDKEIRWRNIVFWKGCEVECFTRLYQAAWPRVWICSSLKTFTLATHF